MSYSEMTEIVQFKIRFYQPGDEIYPEDVDLIENELVLNWPVGEDGKTELSIEEVFKPKPKKHNVLDEDGCIQEIEYDKFIVQHPFIHFEPRTSMSESADWTGMDEEISNMSAIEVFGDYLADILKLAEKFGYTYFDRHIGKDANKVICVLTLWNYWTSTDYYGEHDCGFDLMGAVQMSNIRKTCLTI